MSNIFFRIKNNKKDFSINQNISKANFYLFIEEYCQVKNIKIFINGKEYKEDIQLDLFLQKNSILHGETIIDLEYEIIHDITIDETVYDIPDSYSFFIAKNNFIFISQNGLNYFSRQLKLEQFLEKKNVYKILAWKDSQPDISLLTDRPLKIFMHNSYIGTDRSFSKDSKVLYEAPLILQIVYVNDIYYILLPNKLVSYDGKNGIREICTAERGSEYACCHITVDSIAIGTTGNTVYFNGQAISLNNMNFIENIIFYKNRYLVHSGKCLSIFDENFSFLTKKFYSQNIVMVQKNYLLLKNKFYVLNL